ncbi:hypothetical protein BH10CYA1_BH10CYA1_62420 [soil metagenome]
MIKKALALFSLFMIVGQIPTLAEAVIGQPLRTTTRSCGTTTQELACTHQKTSGKLPKGSPLPDVEIPENDQITAENALFSAKMYERDDFLVEATEFYERALGALRKKIEPYNKKLFEEIVSSYARLLREHHNANKAIEIEREFLLPNKHNPAGSIHRNPASLQ